MQRNATLPKEALKEKNMDGNSVINLASVVKYPSSSQYDRLPPLNPDDLHLPPPPPSAADKTVQQSDHITIGEIFKELYEKAKEIAHISKVYWALRYRTFYRSCGVSITSLQFL
ncbi:hypothetical protein ABG067_005948 [Albugo candida]